MNGQLPIPHRAPFLFVDQVAEASETRIVTAARVRPDADFFRGHYPGNPIMPGVLLCEMCFQSGALLLAHRLGGLRGTPVVTRIGDARFKRMVRPGDELSVEVTLDDTVDNAYVMTGRMSCDGKPVLRITFTCMLVESEADQP